MSSSDLAHSGWSLHLGPWNQHGCQPLGKSGDRGFAGRNGGWMADPVHAAGFGDHRVRADLRPRRPAPAALRFVLCRRRPCSLGPRTRRPRDSSRHPAVGEDGGRGVRNAKPSLELQPRRPGRAGLSTHARRTRRVCGVSIGAGAWGHGGLTWVKAKRASAPVTSRCGRSVFATRTDAIHGSDNGDHHCGAWPDCG